MKVYAHIHGKRWEFEVARERDHIVITSGKETFAFQLDDHKTHLKSCLVDSKKLDFGWMKNGETYQIVIQGVPYDVTVKDQRTETIDSIRRPAGQQNGLETLVAPIPGLISKVFISEGQKVAKNQRLLTLDAMKMENELLSPKDGIVKELRVRPTQAVEKGQVLVVIL